MATLERLASYTTPSDHLPLRLDVTTWRELLTQMGPSLGLWRAAEIAVLRGQSFEPLVLDLSSAAPGGGRLIVARRC